MSIRDIAVERMLPGLIVAAIGWVAAPFVKSKMEGTPLNGVRGMLSFWKGLATHPLPAWSVIPIVLLDLRIVVLPTPEPRWGIGAMKDVPYLSIHLHARLAHKEDHSLEIVKAYLEGTTCVAPFPPIVVAGPYDPSTMVHFGVHPVLVNDGESVSRRVILVDQFGNKHTTEKVTFRPSTASAARFGAAPLSCFFCHGTIAMAELHESSAVPAHKRCVK